MGTGHERGVKRMGYRHLSRFDPRIFEAFGEGDDGLIGPRNHLKGCAIARANPRFSGFGERGRRLEGGEDGKHGARGGLVERSSACQHGGGECRDGGAPGCGECCKLTQTMPYRDEGGDPCSLEHGDPEC